MVGIAVWWPVVAPVKALSRRMNRSVDEHDADPLAIDLDRRYRPLERLLDLADLNFLRNARGYRPHMSRRLKENRLRISHRYLRSLAADFQRIQAAGLELASRSNGTSRDMMYDRLARREQDFFRSMGMVALALVAFVRESHAVSLRRPLDLASQLQAEVRGWKCQQPR